MYCVHGVFAPGECPDCFGPRPSHRGAWVGLGLICVLVTAVAMARTPGWQSVLRGLVLFAVVAGTFRGVSVFFAWTRSR